MPSRISWSVPLILLAISLAATPPRTAEAQSLVYEVKGGVLYHDVPELWSGFSLEHHFVDLNAEVVFGGIPFFLGGNLHPLIGGTVNTQGDTSHAYFDVRWQFELPYNLFAGTGLGVAVHNGLIDPVAIDRKALGSRELFHIPFELGLRLDQHNSVSIYFEHTSNAGLADFNEGLDRMGLRYGYRF